MSGNSKLFFGNLSYSVTNGKLKELLEDYGTVKSVNIIEGKGFGFIEMASPEEAEDILKKLNGFDFEGRDLNIKEYIEKSKNQR